MKLVNKKGRLFGVLGLIVSMALVVSGSGCQLSDEDIQALRGAFFLDPPPQDPPNTIGAGCFAERFVQPAAQGTNKLDLLFVTDSSSSFNEERGAVADGVDAFVAELPAEVDYRVGVMLAHGDLSQYSGRLFRHGSEPLVLDSTQYTLPQIRRHLRTKMTNVRDDFTTDGGEAGMFSLSHGLRGTPFQESRNAGFFRDDAALAVIFVADENDICAEYPAGVTPVPDPNGIEPIAYDYYCKRNDKVFKAVDLLNQLRDLKQDMPLLVGGVIYNDPATMPRGAENEIGYGYEEIIRLGNGISIDLASGSYKSGLAAIGALATLKLTLLTEFTLARANVIQSTLEVEVDYQNKPYTYVPNTNEVHLAPNNAGGPMSIVDIYYCVEPGNGGGGNGGGGNGGGGGSCTGIGCGGWIGV